MNIRRLLSYIAVVSISVLLWSLWVTEHPPQHASQVQASSESTVAESQSVADFVPETFNPDHTLEKVKQVDAVASSLVKSANIVIKTDVLNAAVDLNSGSIINVKLPKYSLSIDDKTPITILDNNPQSPYYANSGFTNLEKFSYSTEKSNYTLQEGQKKLTVTLTAKVKHLVIKKILTFTRGSYAVKVDYSVTNNGTAAWEGSLFNQFTRQQPESQNHMFYAKAYNGAAISSHSIPYNKITYKQMDKKNLSETIVGGWAAMQQHYFLAAWVPETQQQTNYFYSRANNNIYTLGFTSPKTTVSPGKQQKVGATLYVGPEIASHLEKIAPNLERTVDYGWLFWVSIVLFWLMSLVHAVLGNWGWSIVFTTIIIKFILYPLSATSFRSMAKMRKLQPKMKQLKERFADDRQAMSRATMELYKKEGVNPLGGCLPMLIQIPIFIGLYYVIIESVQLRQAPFMLWIHDLAIKDPYYVLPILMGFSMLVQQKLTPSSPDPAQARMMMFVPVVFTVFFVNFPAGLTLYWLVNNVVQILQQYYVARTFEAHQANKARKAKQRKQNKTFRLKQ